MMTTPVPTPRFICRQCPSGTRPLDLVLFFIDNRFKVIQRIINVDQDKVTFFVNVVFNLCLIDKVKEIFIKVVSKKRFLEQN